MKTTLIAGLVKISHVKMHAAKRGQLNFIVESIERALSLENEEKYEQYHTISSLTTTLIISGE